MRDFTDVLHSCHGFTIADQCRLLYRTERYCGNLNHFINHTGSSVIMALVLTGLALIAVILLIIVAHVAYANRRWKLRLESFVERHSQDNDCDKKEKDVLFIVCPASGGGKGMTLYQECMDAFALANRSVQTYITKGSNDLITLQKDSIWLPLRQLPFFLAIPPFTSLSKHLFANTMERGHMHPFCTCRADWAMSFRQSALARRLVSKKSLQVVWKR